MNLAQLKPVWIVTRREIRDQLRDWRVLFPILGLTLVFPFLMNFAADEVVGFVKEYQVDIIGERLIPFLMMIVGFFPVSFSLVIALEAFVGEKERMSIEPLLNTPLKDWQIYLAKLLSSTFIPLFASYLGMTVYIGGLVLRRMILPDGELLLLLFSLTTIHAILMVAGAVVVSSQATSVRAANLLASFIIVPMSLLIIGESVIMFWADYRTLWYIGGGLLVFAVLLVRAGLAHFQREELLGREIDVLNLRWIGQTFWHSFSGGARSLKEWYLRVIPRTIWGMRKAILAILLVAIGGFIIGVLFFSQYDFSGLTAGVKLEQGNLSTSLRRLMLSVPMFSPAPLLWVWWRNVSVLLLGMLLGALSMGVLGTLPIFATSAIMGALMAFIATLGLPAGTVFFALIAPHGIIELAAAAIATAGVLQVGAILATTTPGKTIGEAFITSLAEWCKVMVGFVMPVLFIAAAIEVWVTPRFAAWILNGL
ncbi:MAG TPA: stage II sporulation protein M [Anaerolineaceae bacterium]|nr:stage II sporulation protein M [Anaerolineaceae bacterium]